MATKQQADQFFDFDITKVLADFKVPGVDLETVIASQRKNIDAVTQANKLAYDGFQAVLKRQAEILRQTLGEAAEVSKSLTEPGTPQDKAAKQTEVTKEAFERALANVRELAEIMSTSNAEAMDLLNKRFSQSLDELRDAFLKAKK